MNRLFRIYSERLKFYILILLITTSLVQLGILWSYQNQGLPFNFMNLFNTKETKVSNSKQLQDFFSPFKVVISEGPDYTKLILNKNDSNYSVLWEDAKKYLSRAFKMKPADTYDLSEWYGLIDSKVIVLDFYTNIKLNLLKDFISIPELNSESPTGIYKMIISPWEDITNYNKSISIYINDGIKIYKYDLLYNSTEFSDYLSKYEDIITELNNNSDTVHYYYLKSRLGKSLRGFSEDTTLAFRDWNMSYDSLRYSLPYGIGSKGTEDTNKIAAKILGPENDNYERSVDSNKTIEFKTLNNVYRVYSDGFMTYNYLPAQMYADKGELGEAFKNALEFVSGIETFSENKNLNLFLSGYEEGDKFYRFKFDYMVNDKTNDVPIYMEYIDKDDSYGPLVLNHAIIVTANSKNVLNCKATLKTFEFTGEAKQFGIGPGDATYIRDVKLLENDTIIEKNVSISYMMDSKESSSKLKMAWVIKDGDNYYTSPMIEK